MRMKRDRAEDALRAGSAAGSAQEVGAAPVIALLLLHPSLGKYFPDTDSGPVLCGRWEQTGRSACLEMLTAHERDGTGSNRLPLGAWQSARFSSPFPQAWPLPTLAWTVAANGLLPGCPFVLRHIGGQQTGSHRSGSRKMGVGGPCEAGEG